MTLSECLTRLARASGVAVQSSANDWPKIEQSLGGMTLPADYKALVDSFPDGKFKELITVIRPGIRNSSKLEYLGYWSYCLEDMRDWREDGDGEFPYPIFPEPDGVLPWGEGPRGELFFWLTNSINPESWTVVWADVDFTEWRSFDGSMCEFLWRLVSGEVGSLAGLVTAELAARPAFREFERETRQMAAQPFEATSSKRWGRGMPENEFPELAQAIGCSGGRAEPRDWASLERQLGASLPGDYKSFIDVFGVGTFCDIRILGVDSSIDFDMVAFLRRQKTRAWASSRGRMATFYPDNDGLIAWGEATDGWSFYWRATESDPDKWGVATMAPDFQPAFYDELSFSSFLLKYSGYRDQLGILFARQAWRGGVTFVPSSEV